LGERRSEKEATIPHSGVQNYNPPSLNNRRGRNHKNKKGKAAKGPGEGFEGKKIRAIKVKEYTVRLTKTAQCKTDYESRSEASGRVVGERRQYCWRIF